MAGVKGRSGRKANENVFRHALVEKLDELDPVTDRKKLYAIAKKLIDMALDGDISAIREVMDRVDGKPQQSLIHSNDPDNPLIRDPNELDDAALAAIAAGSGAHSSAPSPGKKQLN